MRATQFSVLVAPIEKFAWVGCGQLCPAHVTTHVSHHAGSLITPSVKAGSHLLTSTFLELQLGRQVLSRPHALRYASSLSRDHGLRTRAEDARAGPG